MGPPREWDVTTFATRDDLRELGRDIVAQMNRRFDEQRELGDQRHSENIDRMDQLASIDTRLTILEQAMLAIKDEFAGIRKRWHDFRDSLQRDIDQHLSKLLRPSTYDDKPVTRKELAVVTTIFLTAMTIAVTVTIYLTSHGLKP
jgi:predicted nuclease with TOPRIM domain